MKFPNIRNQLIVTLKGLSDITYQHSCWVNHNCPEPIKYDEFDLAVHFLFDDTTLYSEPENWIGLCLKNKDEAIKVKEVCDAIEAIFEKYGSSLSDKEYIELPEWKAVLSTAAVAFKCIHDDL